MNRRLLATIICLVHLQAGRAFADGGTVLMSGEQEGYRITVFTSPTPLRAGPVDVSVLVQHPDTGTVVTQAKVEVALRPSDSDHPHLRAIATGDAATNKLFQAALFTLPRPGRWRLTTVVAIDDLRIPLETDVEVAEALPHFSDLWFWTGWPVIGVGLFTVHCCLIHRAERSVD